MCTCWSWCFSVPLNTSMHFATGVWLMWVRPGEAGALSNSGCAGMGVMAHLELPHAACASYYSRPCCSTCSTWRLAPSPAGMSAVETTGFLMQQHTYDSMWCFSSAFLMTGIKTESLVHLGLSHERALLSDCGCRAACYYTTPNGWLT